MHNFGYGTRYWSPGITLHPASALVRTNTCYCALQLNAENLFCRVRAQEPG